MTPRVVHSAKEAIEAAGGVKFVSDLFGFKSTSAVYNWFARGCPAEARPLLGARLRELGVSFPDDLFRRYTIGGGARPIKVKRRKTKRKTRRKARRKNGGRR